MLERALLRPTVDSPASIRHRCRSALSCALNLWKRGELRLGRLFQQVRHAGARSILGIAVLETLFNNIHNVADPNEVVAISGRMR
jgi:hypothetical protein